MNILSSRTSGSLDPDFGNNGQAILPAGLSRIHSGLLGDQRIFSVGAEYESSSIVLTRHLDSGVLDESFGERGVIRIATPDGLNVGPIRHVLLPDGGSLISGATGNLVQGHGFVCRVQPDGSLDSTFGDAGFCLLDLGRPSTIVVSLGLRSDGKAFVILSSSDFATNSIDLYLGLVDTHGQLDSAFGEQDSGLVHLGRDVVRNTLVLPNDSVLIVTMPNSFQRAPLLQFLADGRPDPSFGNDGVFDLMLEQGGLLEIRSLLRQPDGKIVASGGANVGFGNHFLITRLNPDASMDSTFNDGVPKIMVFQGQETVCDRTELQADHSLVSAGTTGNDLSRPSNIVLMRFLPNAWLDTSFGNNGQVMIDFGASEALNQLEIQRDGKLLLAVTQSTFGELGSRAVLARVLG